MQPSSILWLSFLFVSMILILAAPAAASPAAEENKEAPPPTNDESQDDVPPTQEEQPEEPEEQAPPTETTEEPKPAEPTTESSTLTEEEEPNIECPPGQFPAGNPPACVDCEGPCPEEPGPPPNEEGPDQDCLFNPSLPKCASDNGECPPDFFQNEDGNCVPSHPNGCPEGYHSHEDDETGQCIPDDVPCQPGYTRDPDFPTCSSIDSVCRDHPDEDVCSNSNGDNNDDNDNDNNNNHNNHNKVIKIIKNTKVINEINDANDDLDIDRTIVAINYQEGKGINCVFDDDDNGECEIFDVTKDNDKEPLLQIIPFS